MKRLTLGITIGFLAATTLVRAFTVRFHHLHRTPRARPVMSALENEAIDLCRAPRAGFLGSDVLRIAAGALGLLGATMAAYAVAVTVLRAGRVLD